MVHIGQARYGAILAQPSDRLTAKHRMSKRTTRVLQRGATLHCNKRVPSQAQRSQLLQRRQTQRHGMIDIVHKLREIVTQIGRGALEKHPHWTFRAHARILPRIPQG